MIFRQLFDSVSCTYTHLIDSLDSRPGGEALSFYYRDPDGNQVDLKVDVSTRPRL